MDTCVSRTRPMCHKTSFRPPSQILPRPSALTRPKQLSNGVWHVRCVLAAPQGHQRVRSAPAPQLLAKAAQPAQGGTTLADEISRTADVLQELRRGGTWDAKARFDSFRISVSLVVLLLNLKSLNTVRMSQCEFLLEDQRVRSVIYENRCPPSTPSVPPGPHRPP